MSELTLTEYKGKPVILERPRWRFWRHSIFPWGWYDLSQIPVDEEVYHIMTSGDEKPGDGGGGLYIFKPPETFVTGHWVTEEVGHGYATSRFVKDNKETL